MSLLGGFLPTYAQIGVWSYVVFCSLRLLMGIFFGGEYAIGHTFAIEYAPQEKRGMIGGFIQSGFPLGYVLGSLVFALVSFLTTKETMIAHGWRIVFMTGVIPVFLALYIRKNLRESPELEKAKALGKIEKSPCLSLFKPPQLFDFLQVLFFMTGLFLTDYSVYGFLPNILTLKGRSFDTTTYSLILRLRVVHGIPGLQLLWVAVGQDGEKDPDAVVLRIFGGIRNSGFLRSVSRRDCAQSMDGRAGDRDGGDAESWPGESFQPIFASASRRSGAPPVWASDIPRVRCWEPGLALTYGGLTEFHLSRRSRSRICGYRQLWS
jgi:MFS family permease